jgi:predicted dehydrogenase
MDNKETQPKSGLATRRDFIKKTSTAAAVVASLGVLPGCTTTNSHKTPVYGQNQAPSTGRVIGANDRISIGIIGIGAGIGQNHLLGIKAKGAKNNVDLAAACDLFKQRRDWAAEKGELKSADVHSDYRKILDRKDIDCVLVATHDIWHAPISIDAMHAGKHVYCEKPMSRYLDEAFKVYDVVKKTNSVFQIGAQGCSMPAWKMATDLVKAGKVGKLVWSQGYYCRNSKGGEWNDPPFVPNFVGGDMAGGSIVPGASVAANIDWATWQGQVKNKVDFSAERFHRWRKYFPYCAGVLGDLVPHRLHPLMLASGEPQFPSRVVSLGTHAIHADLEGHDMVERQVPEHQQLLAEFPNGYLITLTAGTVAAKSPGFVIYGHKATLNIGEGGNQVDLVPERPFAEDIDPEAHDGLTVEDADIRMHEKNFFDCIRDRSMTPNTNIDLAVRVQTVISLAEMSNRLNVMCLFDEKTRTITTGDGRKVDPITYGTMAES